MSESHALRLAGDWVIRVGAGGEGSIRRLCAALGGGALALQETTGSGRTTDARWTSAEGATLRVRSAPYSSTDSTLHAYTLTLPDGVPVPVGCVDFFWMYEFRVMVAPGGWCGGGLRGGGRLVGVGWC